MKNKPILIALTVIFIGSAKALAQDALFTQWENMPVYLNPALTGNFEGLIRCRANHRNQWASILKDNSYKTSAVSAEYKFSVNSTRKISVGALALQDKAGSLDFRNSAFSFSTSVTQNLGNPDDNLHSIVLGLNAGLITSKIDLEGALWPDSMSHTDINDKTNFADVAAGLLWQYRSKTHFSFNLGSALHHLNRPNTSFSDSNVVNLNHRFNLHGNIEIPLVRSFSMVPSFLFSSQGPSEQLAFGFNNRWYPKALSPNFVQVGIFAKSTKNYSGNEINAYVLSVAVEINSFLLGFSFDRFEEIESNAYEFSIGYTFRGHASKGTASNIGYSPPGIMP